MHVHHVAAATQILADANTAQEFLEFPDGVSATTKVVSLGGVLGVVVRQRIQVPRACQLGQLSFESYAVDQHVVAQVLGGRVFKEWAVTVSVIGGVTDTVDCDCLK